MAKPIGPAAILKEKGLMVYHKTEREEDLELEWLNMPAGQRIYTKVMRK